MAIDSKYSGAFVNSFSNSNLQLIIFPTEQCNFRCTYCYEDFLVGRMHENIVSSIKLLISKRVNLNNLNIMWFGGEPTAAMDIVLDLSQYATNHCTDINAKFSSHMTTNGYTLNAKNMNSLVNVGVNDFQITLDGFEAQHDLTRKRADGHGTYRKIINNLLETKESNIDFRTCIRIHVSKTNADTVNEFVEYINETFLTDERFTANIHPVEPLSSDPNMNQEALPINFVADIVNGAAKTVNEKNVVGYCNSEGYVCYAAMPNSFVIRADGRLGKCTVALSKAENTIGRIGGNGDLIVDNQTHAKWLEGWKSFDEGFLACPVGRI